MAMRLLLVWDVFGHCNRSVTAWPFFARMALGMLFYLGWRPFQLTRDEVDHKDARWQDHPVLSFGMCRLTWLPHRPASVFVNGLRTKFYRNPRPVLNPYSHELEDRVVCDGKLTYAPAVDVCPVLAWLAWAIMNGMFGFAPLLVMNGIVYLNTRKSCFSSAAEVDAVVDSIWAVKPDCVPREMQDFPVFSGQLIGGSKQVVTSTVSNVPLQVGMRLGLDPSKCSAVSGRKTLATATVVHSETNDLDCTRTFGHVNPRLTTQAVYTDASARTADSRAILSGSSMRDLPGSVQLAHRRNYNPDAFLAHQRATAAAAAVGQTAALPTSASEEQQRYRAQVRLSEYRRAYRAETQP